MKTFGTTTILEACPPFALQTPSDVPPEMEEAVVSPSQATRRLWKQAYGEYEPFFASPKTDDDKNNKEGHEQTPTTLDTIDGFDVLGSTQRQAAFLWQISGERFYDNDFLQEQGLDRYLQFLQLRPKASEQKIMLVPTFPIDLMWHTHMLTSLTKYQDDCMAIMNGVLHHDDNHTDRAPGSVLDNSFQQTRQLWMDVYGTEYAVPGGMYRGNEPTESFLVRDSAVEEHSILSVFVETNSPLQGTDIKWVDMNGTTSDGSAAFLSYGNVSHGRAGDEKLCSCGKTMELYLLGRTPEHGVGYYHFETREAHDILLKRLALYCEKLTVAIAMEERCHGCSRSRITPVAKLAKKLDQARALRSELLAQSKADGPVSLMTWTCKEAGAGCSCKALSAELRVLFGTHLHWSGSCDKANGAAYYTDGGGCGGGGGCRAKISAGGCGGGCGGGGGGCRAIVDGGGGCGGGGGCRAFSGGGCGGGGGGCRAVVGGGCGGGGGCRSGSPTNE